MPRLPELLPLPGLPARPSPPSEIPSTSEGANPSMRFDKDTRTLIYEAAPNAATIRWPAGAAEPQKGRVYWMQSLEDAEREKERMEYSPPGHRDVMARMHLHFHGEWPQDYKPAKRKGKRRKPDDVILVLDVKILDRGWEATVAVFEDPDPVGHTGLKTKIGAQPHPTDKEFGSLPTELEPEEMWAPKTRRQREEEDSALKAEHAASVDHAELLRAEKRQADQRRKGRGGMLQQEALERARRRAELAAAGNSA